MPPLKASETTAAGAKPQAAITPARVGEALRQWRTDLLDQRDAAGHWVGQLSPSALSTATAVSALSAVLRDAQPSAAIAPRLRELILGGMRYLAANQNADGGFGDTDRSRSNIATSYLALAAWHLAQQALAGSASDDDPAFVARVEAYIDAAGGLQGLRRRYGKDKTFVVPIMTNCAIAGMVDWKQVPRLPFEAAVFPQSMYRFLQMPVVSYAIPALVAIGQARHFLGPPAILPIRLMRAAAVERTMGVLRSMQPDSGGYLEATPLTSFVLMSLAATGRADGPVAQNCVRFLIDSVLPDGSWPIDTNLATWVTSLSMTALSAADAALADSGDEAPAVVSLAPWCTPDVVQWHLDCQHTQRHPFTGTNPGGWGWSDLGGAVPDGDDTPAAMLALAQCQQQYPAAQGQSEKIQTAFVSARRWLLQLQNRDGGWPTFCRGWGKLPFDRSSVDLTAHAIRALAAGGRDQDDPAARRITARAIARGFAFLARQQQEDGRWLPLWFGNQDLADDENPFYGTGRVLLAYADVGDPRDPRATAACRFLTGSQNEDGGWGGGPSLTDWLSRRGLSATDAAGRPIVSSIEETAVATEALAAILAQRRNFDPARGFHSHEDISGEEADKIERCLDAAVLRGAEFLAQAIESGRSQEAWPIGFYFAKLWYHERLYPAVFATAALSRVLKQVRSDDNAV